MCKNVKPRTRMNSENDTFSCVHQYCCRTEGENGSLGTTRSKKLISSESRRNWKKCSEEQNPNQKNVVAPRWITSHFGPDGSSEKSSACFVRCYSCVNKCNKFKRGTRQIKKECLITCCFEEMPV